MKARISIIMKWQETGKESRLHAVVDFIKGYPEHFKLEALFFDESKAVQPLNVHDVVKIMQTIGASLAAGDYEPFRM